MLNNQESKELETLFIKAKSIELKMFCTDIIHAEKLIRTRLHHIGEFTHNVVSVILRGISNKHGFDAANYLVDKLDLNNKLGIGEVS